MGLPTTSPRPLAILGAAALALLLIWGAASWWSDKRGTELTRAMSEAPKGSERYAWTHWEKVVKEPTEPVGDTSVEALLDAAYDADFSSTSALVTSAEKLVNAGLSIFSLKWELFAQSPNGAVTLLRPEDPNGWWDQLLEAGWTESGGVFDGTETVRELGLSPELNYARRINNLIATSNNADYLTAWAKGSNRGVDAEIRRAAIPLDDTVSAVVFDGDYACGHLAMSQADDYAQEQARLLLHSAGQVDPMTAFSMGYDDQRNVTVAMTFEDDKVATANARSREELASGEAPGQGGTFAERFTVDEVKASGTLLEMALTPVGDSPVLSDLSSGPVLYASC